MKIKFGETLISIEFVERMPQGWDNYNGKCDMLKNKITILELPDSSVNEINKIFWHEIAHAITYLTKGKHCRKENYIERMGSVLYKFFGDYRKFLIDDKEALNAERKEN